MHGYCLATDGYRHEDVPRERARAEAAAFARKRDHVVATAVIAVHAGEAMRQHATAQERIDLPHAEARHRPLIRLDPAHE
jgi:hypothetical protein